jgi:hypothetical protein
MARHYTWSGSGGTDSAETREVIPRAGGGSPIPIGTGVQPTDFDLTIPGVDPVEGYSKEKRASLSGDKQLARERVANLMPQTGKRS